MHNRALQPTAIATIDAPFDGWPFWVSGNILGPYARNAAFAFRQYDGEGNFVQANNVRTNNLGWVASLDYPIEKAPNEFRVAFIGDSLTASITNEVPWVTVAQRELQRAVGRPVLLMNLGVPGLGPARMKMITLPVAQRLRADLVVVNLVIEGMAFLSDPPVEGPRPKPASIGGALIDFNCQNDRSRAPCNFVPVWTVSAGRQLGRVELATIKAEASRIAAWKSVLVPSLLVFAPSPATGGNLHTVGEVSGASPDEQEDGTIHSLQAMRRSYPNLIVTINPLAWYYDPATTPPQLRSFKSRARAARLDVIDMRERMPEPPANVGAEWYNLPHDGHWNDAGAELYGRAMARLLAERVPELADSSLAHW